MKDERQTMIIIQRCILNYSKLINSLTYYYSFRPNTVFSNFQLKNKIYLGFGNNLWSFIFINLQIYDIFDIPQCKLRNSL